MNNDFSSLSLNELYDKLSELTITYSKSMLNGLSEKEFASLRSGIEEIQKEIAKRKDADSKSIDSSSFGQQSKSANA
jgi:hypothetical protein